MTGGIQPDFQIHTFDIAELESELDTISQPVEELPRYTNNEFISHSNDYP